MTVWILWAACTYLVRSPSVWPAPRTSRRSYEGGELYGRSLGCNGSWVNPALALGFSGISEAEIGTFPMPIRDPFMLISLAMDELFFFSRLDEAFLFSSLFIVPVIWLLLRIKWWYALHRPSFLRLGFVLLLAFAVSLVPL